MRLRALFALVYSFALFWFVAGFIALPDMLMAAAALKLSGASRGRIRRAVSVRQSKWNGWLFDRIVRIMRIRLKLELPKYDNSHSAVVVMNHQNFFDVLVVGGVIPRTGRTDTRWVIKKEVLNIPVIGQMARLSGCMPVARSKNAGDLEMMAEAAREFAQDNASFLIFPEGHRFIAPKQGSTYQHLLPPKHAGFEALCDELPDYGALDITVAWLPPLPQGKSSELDKLLELYGRTLDIHARLADPAAVRQPDWIENAWKRKEKRLAELAQKYA